MPSSLYPDGDECRKMPENEPVLLLRKALEEIRSTAHYGNEIDIKEACGKLNHCETTAINALGEK